MEEIIFEEHWRQLVKHHFGDLKRDTLDIATVGDVVNRALLGELRWAVSKKQFENHLKGEDDVGLLLGLIPFATLYGLGLARSEQQPVRLHLKHRTDTSPRNAPCMYLVVGRNASTPP